MFDIHIAAAMPLPYFYITSGRLTLSHQTQSVTISFNMRYLITVAALISCCLAEAPYPPSGTRPKGPLLVLPGEYGPPKAGINPRLPTRGDVSNLEEETAKLMERLRQEAGSERGVYHVYLKDGRLQRVQYTTAPINSQPQPISDNYLQRDEAGEQRDLTDPSGVYYVKAPGSVAQTLRAPQAQQSADSYKVYADSETSGRQVASNGKTRLASIHFMDVEPIPPPIYSLSPKPLARILRALPAPSLQIE